MARRARRSASATAAARGSWFPAFASSNTRAVLRRIFSSMAAKAWLSLPPWYSTEAQMTPPALAMKSGTLRWTAAGLIEAQKTFRRLKAYRQLPILRSALQDHMRKAQANNAIGNHHECRIASATSDACLAFFNRERDIVHRDRPNGRGRWRR